MSFPTRGQSVEFANKANQSGNVFKDIAKADAGGAADLMKKLGAATKDRRAARRMAKNKDTIQELLHSLNTKPKFTKMVEYSLECLKNLAVDEVSVEEMIDEGTIDTIMKILQINPFNEQIMAMVNKTLSAFCKNDRMADMIAKKMGGKPFVLSMKKHVNPDVLEGTCKSVTMLCTSPEAVDSFVKAGMLEGAAHVIKNNPDNSDVLAAAAACLDKAAAYGENAATIMKTDAVPNLLEAMKKYGDNADLVKHGVSLLGKIANSSPELLEELKKMGCVDIITAALENHPDNDEICEIGARALMALAGEQDVQSALQISPGCNLATANAMGKIASLMLVQENVDYMIQNEGVKWIMSALKASLGQDSAVASKILAAGCRALKRIGTDEMNVYQIMQEGGVGMCIQIAQQHAADEKVAQSAIDCLSKFLGRPENVDYVLKSGGVDATIAVGAAHSMSAITAKACLKVYEGMCSSPDGLARMAQPDAIASILSILKNHGAKDPELAKQALNALKAIGTTPENIRKIVAAGGLKDICDILSAHSDNPEICELALGLLEEASKDQANHDAMREAGVMDAILGVIENHPDNANLQEMGARTLAMVAGEAQLVKSVENVQELADKITQAPGLVKSLIDKFNAGLGLLSNLCLVDDNVPPLMKAGAVRALISAFEACNNIPAGPKRDKALNDSVQGIMRLAKNPEACKEIVKSGAFAKMLGAGMANPDNEELCENVMGLCATLMVQPEYAGMMGKTTSLEDIIKMANLHPFNEKIAAAALQYLSVMCTDDDACRAIIAAGGAGVVVEGIFLNMDNPDALLAGLQVLNTLAVDDATVSALIAAGALDAILEALRRYPNDVAIVNSCVQALCRLLINEDVAKAVGDKGGVPLLVAAMRTHFAEESICEVDMIVMDSLASVDTNAEKLLEEELQTVELVKWIQEQYSGNKALVEASERLLKTLVGTPDEDLIITDEAAKLDADSCEALLGRILGGELDEKQMQLVLGNISALCQNANNAKMMIKHGGPQALAKVMKDWKDNEAVYMSAATAFATLCEHMDDDQLQLLEDPDLIAAMCEMIAPHAGFANPMDLSTLSKAIGACAKMQLRPEVVEEMLKNQPLESLMRLVLDSDDPLLLAQASRLLGKLSNDDAGLAKLAEITNLQELIQALRRNINNQEFLKYGVYLLAQLAQDDEIKTQIGLYGGVVLVIEIMQKHKDNAALIENCCYAAQNFTYDCDVNITFITACKGIPVFLELMAQHSTAEELLDSAVGTLCNCCLANDANKDAIMKADGAATIVETILNNFNSIDLLQTCLRTLGNLAYNSAQCSAIIQAGAVQGIVAGLTVHCEELEIIDTSVRVLTNLASELEEQNQEIMAQEGAVQAIVEVAVNMKSNLEIEQSAIGCLCNLAAAPVNATMIVKQGGMEAVLNAMNELSFDADLVASGMNLMLTLSQITGEVDRILNSNVVPNINQAMAAHSTNEEVCTPGVTCLENFAFNENTAAKVGEQGAIQGVLIVMDANEDNGDVLAACYKAFSNICRNEGNAVAMAESTCDRAGKNLTRHRDTYSLCSPLLAYLGNLAVHPEASKIVVTKTAILEKVLLVANEHVEKNPNIVKRACRAVENMAYSTQAIRDHMKNMGVVEGLKRWLSATHDDVKLAAQSAINSINREEHDMSSMNMVKMTGPLRAQKSVKELFGDVKEDKPAVLTKETRNFLLGGALLQKHSKTAQPRSRHVYVSDDLKWLIWKDPKKPVTHDTRMKVFKIRECVRGRCTKQLMRKGMTGKFLCKSEECAFSIQGRDRDSLDLEAGSEAEREKWIACIEELVAYIKAQKNATAFKM